MSKPGQYCASFALMALFLLMGNAASAALPTQKGMFMMRTRQGILLHMSFNNRESIL